MNPTRLEIFKVLEALSRLFPEMRFGQLVVNLANIATGLPDMTYDVEDEEFLDAAQKFLERQTDRLGTGVRETVNAGRAK